MTVDQVVSRSDSVIDLSRLHDYVERGLVKAQRHPSLPLTIWNYTPHCQWEGQWDDITMQCRGLVTDDDGVVIARPFSKFFNLDEHEELFGPLPDEPFEVYEKLDGSLIILFRYQDQTVVASRGSFVSGQAERARRLLVEKYADAVLITGVTYCLEIIYPENRIVINYGQREELVLLAVINTETGREHYQFPIGFPVVRAVKHEGGFRDLPQQLNEEGYVIRFKSGMRIKVKNEEYVRLHRLLTQTTPKTIWESLRDGVPLSEFLDRVPDEFNEWVRHVVGDLKHRQRELESQGRAIADPIEMDQPRADIARIVTAVPKHLQPIVWMLLDDKDTSPYTWKLVKPVAGDYPFRSEASA